MPPPSIPTGQSRMSNSTTSSGFTQVPKIFLLALVVATSVRLAIVHILRRKRKIGKLREDVQEKDSTSKAPLEKDSKEHQHPESKDQEPSTFKPVYPWVSPPQPLPGPYDPRLYPLPTIRRHSYDPSTIISEENKAISYSRRVSTNSIPARHSTLQGTVTTSSKGWRRNQWVVGGG